MGEPMTATDLEALEAAANAAREIVVDPRIAMPFVGIPPSGVLSLIAVARAAMDVVNCETIDCSDEMRAALAKLRAALEPTP